MTPGPRRQDAAERAELLSAQDLAHARAMGAVGRQVVPDVVLRRAAKVLLSATIGSPVRVCGLALEQSDRTEPPHRRFT
jgi:hypothetical protein